MAFSMSDGGTLRAEINITPLIDVLLVLLIVFMVVVSVEAKQGLYAQIPQPPRKDTPHAEQTVVIRLASAGEDQVPIAKINDEKVAWVDLHARLFDIFKLRVERVAFVQGDDDVDFQYVADAISIARDSGVDRVGLLPQVLKTTP